MGEKRTCSQHGLQAFHHSSPQIKGSSLGSMVEHGIFPGDLVNSNRMIGKLSRKKKMVNLTQSERTMRSNTDHFLCITNNVEVRTAWLDHEHIGPFVHISLLVMANTRKQKSELQKLGQLAMSNHRTDQSSSGESSRPGGQLIALSVTRGRGGLCCIPERSVETRGKLCAVAHHRHPLTQPIFVQGILDGKHSAIHHIRRGDDVGTFA